MIDLRNETACVCQNYIQEEFEHTKGAIRIRISKKNRHHNGQKTRQRCRETIIITGLRLSFVGFEMSRRFLCAPASRYYTFFSSLLR